MTTVLRSWRIVVGLLAVLAIGCDGAPPRRTRTLQSRGSDSGIYLTSVAGTLNDMAANTDLNLLPAQPILTASSSNDGKEVRAICTPNPEVPDGPVNYLRSVDGNANFYALDVRPGDIVRYYVQVDRESAQMDIMRRTALELRVRRLDTRDPQNALIIEGGLNASNTDPARIEIWRYSDKRMDAIRSAIDRYVNLRRPALGWEPTPDLGALRQIGERANQWYRNQPAAERDWRPSPLIAELPSEVRLAKGVAEMIALEKMRDGSFDDWEPRLLEQAIWLRDISQWAKGDATDDPTTAARLFDWTMRNVALDGPGVPPTVEHPWQALAYGHGDAKLRAWVFVELCRQQRIPAVILRAQTEGDPEKAPLLVGVLIDKELYLFDPQLGVPLPGGKGPAATLAELVADPALVRQLDVEGKFTYPVDEKMVAAWDAFVVGSPTQLSRRSQILDAALEGDDYAAMFADVDATAKQLKEMPELKSVQLWGRPFESLAAENEIKISARREVAAEFAPFAERPLLWKARLLHFQGAKEVRAEEKNDPLAEAREGHADALKLYQDPTVRPGTSVLAKLEPAKQTVYGASKANASYWLGLLCYDRGKYDIAADWLGERTLDKDSKGRWAEGARYNLARTYEALGQFDKAIELLDATPADSPYRDGNLVLAKQLGAKRDEASKASEGEKAN